MTRCSRLVAAVLALVGIAVVQTAVAATYYVNAAEGDDAALGTAAVAGAAGSGPWKTLARASAQDFRNGDELLFRCGQTHRGRLAVRIAQGEGQLRIGGYGTCTPDEMPRLEGTTALPTNQKNGQRSAPLAFEPGRVVLNGSPLAQSSIVARVVADPSARDGARLAPPLPPGADLDQARAFVRTRDWLVEPVAFKDGAWLPLTGASKTQYPIAPGTMLAITGKPWTLGRTGWVYDTQNRELLVAGTGEIAVAEQAPLVQVTGAGSVLIDKVHLAFAGEDAIHINIRGTAAVRGSTITAPARRAIHIENAASLYAIDNRITGAGEDAIHIISTPRANVLRNRVTDTATLHTLRPAFGAINVSRAKAALVSQNTIERSAYVGIRFGEGAEISSNIVVDSCMRLSDCAAIYTWQKTPSATRQPSTVSGNLIVGVYGNDEVKLGFRVWAVGIYLDDFSSNITALDNLVFGARQAYYLHNAFRNRLDRNQSFGDLDASISVQIDSQDLLSNYQRGLGNSITNHLLMYGDRADALSVARRVKIDPFLAFDVFTLIAGSEKPTVTWYDNTSVFDTPDFKRQSDTFIAASGITFLQNNVTLPKQQQTRTWGVKQLPGEVQIASVSSSFALVADSAATNSRCNEISKVKTMILTNNESEMKLLHCPPNPIK